MIGYLKGIVAELTENALILDVGGVGFEVKISAQTAAELPGIGEECRIYTYMAVKEDDISLFGFPTRDDLNFFKLLITVSGIGPKGAQQILSAMRADDLRFAILTGDAKAIARAPGIGLKTAQKAILELKDKVSDQVSEGQVFTAGPAAGTGMVTDERSEAAEALAALGYSSTEAYKAVKQVPEEITDANDILKAALKYL